MEIKIKVVTELALIKNDNYKYPLMKGVSVELIVPDILDKDKYIDPDKGYPNYDGTALITNTLTQGLIANIHMAHQNKFYDSAAHLRKIIKDLEDGFIGNMNIEKINK